MRWALAWVTTLGLAWLLAAGTAGQQAAALVGLLIELAAITWLLVAGHLDGDEELAEYRFPHREGRR